MRIEGILPEGFFEDPASEGFFTRLLQSGSDTAPLAKFVPRITVKQRRGKTVVQYSPNEKPFIDQIFGTTNSDFSLKMLNMINNGISPSGNPDELSINAALAAVAAFDAKNEIEAMMVVQIVLTNFAAARVVGELSRAQTLEQEKISGNLAAKFSRLGADLIEKFQKHRGKPHQKVSVEHVHVNAGGQAIVGHVSRDAMGDRGTPD